MEYNSIIGSNFKPVFKPYLSVTGGLSLKNPPNLINSRRSTLSSAVLLNAKKLNDNHCIHIISKSTSLMLIDDSLNCRVQDQPNPNLAL